MKNKTLDYIFGLITGIAIMLALNGCLNTPLQAHDSAQGSVEWNPIYVKVVD